MITIKKYPNRRLYDTSKSSYVNIDYILELVRAHKDFEIVDSKTGEDQTKNILLQIISDQESDTNRSILTNTLLKQLIRFYSSDMQPFVRNYLEQSLASFLEQQETMQTMVRSMVDASPATMMNKMMTQNMKMWGIPIPGSRSSGGSTETPDEGSEDGGK